ncbi:MAG: class I SAM-dependent methyltransferase [Ruminococcaceae bacterium]|jgi:SAM-dependent methyltransferase|nr:class I SAM-dependent methyltransferase [Oscillospiraceae bacterium]
MNMFEYFGYFGEESRDDRLLETERAVLAHLFDKYLPKSGRLLDSAAGNGENAFRFASLGYEVTAGDLIADRVDAMKADPRASSVREFFCAAPRSLGHFDDESFDIVISLGAMYLARTRAEREAFVRESMRVLAEGGIFAYSFMTPFAMTVGQFISAALCTDSRTRLREFRTLSTVEKTHSVDMFSGTTMEEITDLSREYGLEILTVASTYGAVYSMADDVAAMDDAEYEKFKNAQIATCEDPFAARYAMRGLVIGRKKALDDFD